MITDCVTSVRFSHGQCQNGGPSVHDNFEGLSPRTVGWPRLLFLLSCVKEKYSQVGTTSLIGYSFGVTTIHKLEGPRTLYHPVLIRQTYV